MVITVKESMVKESPPFRAEILVALGWGEGGWSLSIITARLN